MLKSLVSSYKNYFHGNGNVSNSTFDRSYYLQTTRFPMWSDRSYYSFALDGYIKNVVANRCISLISKSAANVKFVLFKISSDGSKKEITKHNLIDILNNPNPTFNYQSFMENIIANLLLSGNSYVYGIKDSNFNLSEMFTLRPDRVKVISGFNSGIPSGYKYTVENVSMDFTCDENTGVSDILHIKNFHPLDDWYGLSAMEAASYSIDQHNECIRWNKALLENGARPSGALVVKSNLTDKQFSKLKESLDEKLKGSDNAGKIMILEGGLEWQNMSLNPKDMDFIQTKNIAARDIAMSFGVPAQILGIPGDNTYSNMIEARISLWEETIIPTANKVLSSICNWYCKSTGNLNTKGNPILQLELDLDSIPALVDKRNTQYEMMQNSEFLNDSEKRNLTGFGSSSLNDNNIDSNNETKNSLISNKTTSLIEINKTLVNQNMILVNKLRRLEEGDCIK